MKFKFALVILLFLQLTSFSQTTFFIKYKSSVPLYEIGSKIAEKKISTVLENRPIALPDFQMEYLAKGIARDDETLGRIITLKFTEKLDANYLAPLVLNDPDIEYIEESRTYKIDSVPNDSLVSQQWALEKIKAFDAWNITQGVDSVLLAIIDTGIDYNHPDLMNKIYLNAGETGFDSFGNDKRFNGIDDDGNGFIDDFHGWDFTDRVGFPFDSTGGDYLNWDNDPFDDQGHGTFIAGIAAAETNNFIGIAGTAPNIKLLNLRAFDPGGYGEEDDVAAAILYAIKMNAKVINMSFGDNSFSLVLRDVIQYAYSQNLVLIASAGNSGSNLPHYPSGYSEVISVGNSTPDDFVAGSSNWGSTIDLVAPGTGILTTSKNSGYASINGTSASAPFVSATAALILSLQNFSNEEIKQILKSTTDDIGESGWDLRSGAGRLNTEKALRVLAPSIVKFHNPKMDYATSGNSVEIIATVLSAYFQSYKLDIGVGLNPTSWQSLINEGLNQFNQKKVYELNTSNLSDTSYTLRIILNQSNGRTLEERVNFHLDRTPPQTELISVGPMYYGDKLTILSAVYTDEPSLVRLYYKKAGEAEYKFITLDGFTTNNQFVKQLHYGFIPKELVDQNSIYYTFIEAENLVGLKTTIKNNGNDFIISTVNEVNLVDAIQMPFSLPLGSPYQNPISLTNSFDTEVILRTFSSPRNSTIYSFSNGNFIVKDSISDRFVKDHGDFNRNGLTDLLTFFVRDGFIMEQSNLNSSTFLTKFSKTGGDFWPILARDIDNDGITEVLAVKNDSTISVWEVEQNLNVAEKTSIKNFTQKKFGGNIIDFPNAIICDSNGDGIFELWFVDADGDIFSFRITGDNTFTPDITIPTEFIGSNAYLAAGDYNYDGITDIAVLLHSIEPIDIAPYYRLIIFSLAENHLSVIYDFPFIDAAVEFNNSFRRAENSLRFIDIDNDGGKELILFTFPYAYIFKYFPSGTKLISYFENINSNSILVSDFNSNYIPEIAFPNSNGIDFYEFASGFKTPTPFALDGFSVDSTNVKLNWISDGEKFIIYKGTSFDNLAPIDSVFTNTYNDNNVSNRTDYFYAVQAYNSQYPEAYSGLSKVIKVYVHNPAKISDVTVTTSKNIIVRFNEKIKTTIENLQSFEVINFGYPNSVSPADQFSYLISFDSQLPSGLNSLLVKNLRDFYNSPIDQDTVEFTVMILPERKEFFITGSEILNPYRVNITFNFPVDEATASDKNNYSFSPSNTISSVNINNNIVTLDLSGGKPIGSVGKEYVLRIRNLKSSPSSGNIPIKSGAGSYIVLTGTSANLSDVFVYPNPARIGEGTSRITFANLTSRVKINILTLSGKQIKEIIENTDNGGVEYDLTDEKGEKIPSGIYIYRIVSLDDSRNETQEIFGKFAVIR
ncbi:Subtilisin-like serine protease [Ignavibacterium album JCM 16511]|uniref:Subtilisin-like serine protease n=1 Tax=Ignavibacterium album (strain DSM 19864 / JCM 16511 / NBRC 101810 / Mat9-16) TaxID=945713 RepID=I0AJX9_IGNAJ|nr:S8 family serine peptidase [Ignavibacterium album]AFH49286.1 Subtilisin-like serine protease [Ignavibacterium album JCM 16511]